MENKFENLFITGTPYQLIAAFNICKELYASSKYFNIIYFTRSEATDYNLLKLEVDSNIDIIRFDINDWYHLANSLRSKRFNRFFFFLENSIYDKYLAYYLKRNGTIICLAPDGTKPYGIYKKKHETLSMLIDTWRDYKLLRARGLKLPDLIWSRYYRYGSLKFLDEVWLQFPELFNSRINKTKGKIVRMPELKKHNLIMLKKIFGFTSNLLVQNKNIILYFNQPFSSKALIDKEMDILSKLNERFPDKKIFVKLHPSTPNNNVELLSAIPYLFLIKDKMPAEFYLANISNSLILTGWSAAVMHLFKEQSNTCYYLYPMYADVDDKVMSQMNLIAFPHVQMIGDFGQLNWSH
ncbi:hypothetical protein MASR2M44_14030 [Bacteroidota bacterium]